MSSVFKTSINIKYDLGKEEFFNRYIPTSAHSEILKGIIDGLNHKGTRSHIAIGPYGTGKSLISTLIAGIVSRSVDSTTIDHLESKFSKSDEEIYKKINKLKEVNKMIPVILNGYEGDFETILLEKIHYELKKNDVNVIGNTIHLNILETIKKWEKNYPLLFSTFLAMFKETSFNNLEEYLTCIKSEDNDAINWFVGIYPLLTGGNTFDSFSDQSFMAAIEQIFEQTEKQGKGIFIIYDEFGRFLQTLPENKIEKTMGILQDLAEFIDHKSKTSSLLFITHKHLSSYFVKFSEDLKNEFNRIEKRFKTYTIKNDQETFFDIANEIIKNSNEVIYSAEYIEKQISMLRKYSLFDYNQVVIQNKIIKGCYPVHPVSTYLLIKLSGLFGQNERTLFTFLESEDTGGLVNHIKKSNMLYLPYNLFDYFFSNYKDISFEENPNSVKMFFKLEKRISSKQDSKIYLLNILKFISIWEETNSNSIQKLTNEFLNYVFNEDISQYIDVLKQLKLLRYNRILHKWELFEGSPIDINKKIEETRRDLIITEKVKIELLNNLLPVKHYFSNQYNHEKSMTRFTNNFIISTDDFFNDSYGYSPEEADMCIYFLLKGSNKEHLSKKIEKDNSQYKIFCLTNLDRTSIENSLIKWFCLNSLLNNKEYYTQNEHLKDELLIELKDIEHELIKKLNKSINVNEEQIWIYQSQKLNFSSENEISNFLSSKLNEIYKFTPEIKNDMFNRKNISNQQLKAAKNLIDHIMINPLENDFGIRGSGPDYLIFATVFKNNKFLGDIDSSEISDKGLKNLYNRVINEIEIKKRSRFVDLINIFINPPFGIRKPIIPVLLVGILKNKWNYMMFFSKGSFIPNITGETLYDMLEHPEDFEYIVFEYDESYTEFFEEMSIIFEEHKEILLENKPLHIRVAAAMLKWLQSLPKITQTTDKLEKHNYFLRENIKKIEIDPYLIFKKLRKSYEDDNESIGMIKFQLDSFFADYLEKLEIKIYQYLEDDGLKEWVKINKINHPQNLLLKILENCDYHILLNELSTGLIGVDLYDWTELTEFIFFNELDKQLKDIKQIQFDPSKHMLLTFDDDKAIIHKNIELSSKANLITNNINRIIDTQGKFITKEELDFIIYTLINKYLK